MKKIYVLLLVLFVMGVSSVSGQTNQALTQGQIFTGTMTPGAVHTFRMQLRTDAEYFISWDDSDTNYSGDYADIIVGVRGDNWGQYLVDVMDGGNFGRNVHRLINQNQQNTKRNPLNLPIDEWDYYGEQAEFAPNREYIIEVRGYNRSSSGTYRIVFY